MGKQECGRCRIFAKKRDRHPAPNGEEWCRRCIRGWRQQTYTRTGKRLYVVAPNYEVFRAWCADHELDYRARFIVPLLPTNPHRALRGQRHVDYTVAPAPDVVVDRFLAARMQEVRAWLHIVGATRVEDVEEWLKENLI